MDIENNKLTYTINDVKLILREEIFIPEGTEGNETGSVNIKQLKLIALVNFSYKNQEYTEAIKVATMLAYTVDNDGNIVFDEDNGYEFVDPSTITKEIIDEAISDAIDISVTQVEAKNRINTLKSIISNYSYAYTTDV